MREAMEFWRTCHTIFELDMPNSVDITSPELSAEVISAMCHVQSTSSKQCLAYQFYDKLININIVPRHKSTDRKDMLWRTNG